MTKGEQVVRFSVQGLAPASYSGNSRVSWRQRHADGVEYAERVWCAARSSPVPPWGIVEAARVFGEPVLPWPRAKLTLTQRAIRLRDVDNFLSSFKPGLDTLTTKGTRPLGILQDDSPECLVIEVKSERVRTKAEECVIVEISRLEGV